MQFAAVVVFFAALATAAPPAIPEYFQVEKRCQGNGAYCDSAAFRCCGGVWCCPFGNAGVHHCSTDKTDGCF
ncbi:hypothetical protein P280DRAFT_257356 [Massarina eburnea CBS 473.64]|uniref:Granulins domain-containing protein n=1 Tax=Massarina eburnea CBS 473.64 TaxID=1395130 RepID=A0A6A6RJ46_9PLEO|nr:hypothetical protein P280DRAFT_257356 [Massarina eburnea CBS 473.64]